MQNIWGGLGPKSESPYYSSNNVATMLSAVVAFREEKSHQGKDLPALFELNIWWKEFIYNYAHIIW